MPGLKHVFSKYTVTAQWAPAVCRHRGELGKPEAGAADCAQELQDLSKRLADALVLTEDPAEWDAHRFVWVADADFQFLGALG